MIIITDLAKLPLDEGSINSTFNLLKCLYKLGHRNIFLINGDKNYPIKGKIYNINRFLINSRFFTHIKNIDSDSILYIPESSITLSSFIRSFLLKFFSKKKVYLIGFQHRKYNLIYKLVIRKIQPECVFVLSNKSSNYLNSFGIKNISLQLGVDNSKFFEYKVEHKILNRKIFNIPLKNTVILHIGHIKCSRNLQWFLDIKKVMPEIDVVIGASSYNSNEKHLLEALRKNGIKVLKEFNSTINDLYNLATYYVFPLKCSTGAIETPLSVLEAMACNLPIITTKFGSLADTFKEDRDFHYAQSSQDIINIIKKKRRNKCRNREKIFVFTWEAMSRNISEILEK